MQVYNIGTVSTRRARRGGEMYQRDDDNEATVRNRLDVYEKSTSPLIDYHRGCRKPLAHHRRDRDPVEVFADVKEALNL